MAKVVGVGAGGHAKVVIEILRLMGQMELVGLLDSNEELWETEVLGIRVLGRDHLLSALYRGGVRHAFIGVGSYGEMGPRRCLYTMVKSEGFEVVAAIHPGAMISSSAEIGRGATIMAGAVINAEARLGENIIVNTGAIIEHDCVIGSHAHIASGARLAGKVEVGEGTHIGIGASVRQSIHIGRNVTVGAGAVVIKDLPDDVIAAGIPARVIRKRSGSDD